MNMTPNYTVLARRTRPQSFSELFGQNHISQALGQIVSSGKIPHAFLLTGTRGTGKTSTARILAKSLCCEKGPTLHPCQTCVHCTQITASAHEDVLEIDGASNTGVENIRDLKELVRFLPKTSRYRVIIIDEVHMLSTSAFNALLKTLEEPPPQVVFVLATTELQKMPVTVRSRCLVFSFRKVAADDLEVFLEKTLEKDGIPFEKEALKYLAREAKGSLRDALSLLEQALAVCTDGRLNAKQVSESLSQFGEEHAFLLFQAICASQQAEALHAVSDADNSNIDMGTLLETCARLFREALIIRELPDKSVGQITQLLPSEQQRLSVASAHLAPYALSECFRVLMQGSKDSQKAGQPLGWAQVAALDALSRAQWLSPQQILESTLNSPPGGQGGPQAPSIPKPFSAGQQVSNAGQEQLRPLEQNITKTEPPPEKPQSPHESAPKAVDFDLLRSVSTSLESLGQPLFAAKIRNLKFQDFNSKIISFEGTDSFSDQDCEMLTAAFRNLTGSVPVPHLPRAPKPGQKERRSQPPLTESKGSPVGPSPALAQALPSTGASTLSAAQGSMPSSNSGAGPSPSPAQKTGHRSVPSFLRNDAPTTPSQGSGQLSLAEHTQRNKDEAFQKKAQEVLGSPELQDLLKHAKSAVVLPLEPRS